MQRVFPRARRATTVVLVLLASTLTVVMSARPAAASTNTTPSLLSCTRLEVIGVRGSGEPYSQGNGMGNEAWAAYQQLEYGIPDAQFFGLPYAAIAIVPNTIAVLSGPYGDSETEGAIMLKSLVERLVNYIAVNCPYEKLAFIGYSQGAQVIGDELAGWGANPTIRSHIAGILMFGDPRFDPSSPVDDATYDHSLEGVFYARTIGSTWWGSMKSYCIHGDPICNYSIDNLADCVGSSCPHNNYVSFGYAAIGGSWLANIAGPQLSAPSGTPMPTTPINYLADRTVLHAPNGSLYVMAGGAKFAFGSMTEFSNLGYSTAGMVNIDNATVASIPNIPRDGTVLRSGGGNIYVVAGGAKFLFGSWGEFTSQGYGSGSYINVPQSPLDQIGDAPGNMPRDGTILRHPNGNVYLVAGGVKFLFGSMTELSGLGYSTNQIIYVSGAPTDGIPTASIVAPPRNGTLLRSGGGQIYVVAGGSKFQFGTMDQVTSSGYQGWYNVPQAPLDQIGDAPGNMPGNGTIVLRPDGALFVIAGGVRWQFGSMAEFASEGYTTYTPVSQAPLDGIYDASSDHLPANETVFQGTDSTIWVMKNGVRRSFTSMAQFTGLGYTIAQVVRVPDAVLNSLPSGGSLT